MIIIIGLVILVAAVVVGVVGVLSNAGSGHALTGHFAVFGYHVTGSDGTLFLYGLVVGALALLGLSLLLAGARRTSRRGHEARRGLRRSRRETAAASQDRDDLLTQRETARAYTASTPGNGVVGGTPGNGVVGGTRGNGLASGYRRPGAYGSGRRSRWHLFGHRTSQAAPPAQTANGRPAPGIPADASTTAD